MSRVTKIVSEKKFQEFHPDVKASRLYLSAHEIPNDLAPYRILVMNYDDESDSFWDRGWIWADANDSILMDRWFVDSVGNTFEPGEAIEAVDVLTKFDDDWQAWNDYGRNSAAIQKLYGIGQQESPIPAIENLLDMYFDDTPDLRYARMYFKAYRWVMDYGVDVAE